MAKKTEEPDDTLAANTQVLAAQDSELMRASDEIPAFIQKGDTEGTLGIAPEDARIPRLSLAQPLSPQILDGDMKRIEGLSVGMSFNDLTEQIYGKDPLNVIVVRADKPRWVEFAEDRSVIDPAVPAGDPRTEFTTDNKGNRIPPAATCFYDYVILRGPELEPLAWSCKGSAIGITARPLNGLIRVKPVPIYGCWYKLIPKQMKNDKGTWYVYVPKQTGFVTHPDVYKKAKEYFDIFKQKPVDFDQHPEPEPSPTTEI